MGIQACNEVIVSPFTLLKIAEAVVFLGVKPVFVGIEPITYNVNLNLIEEKPPIKPKPPCQ